MGPLVAAAAFLSSKTTFVALQTADVAVAFAFVILPTFAVFSLLRLPGFRGRRVFSFLLGVACYVVVLVLGIGLSWISVLHSINQWRSV